MAERPLIDLTGAVDIHVHTAPSYTHYRPYDDDVTALQALEAGMSGLVYKDHSEPTVTRAYLAQKAAPGVRVFGGIVLNHSVGGVNPAAADFACTMGAGQVWLPTVDAQHHVEVFGQRGDDKCASDRGSAEPPKKSRFILRKSPIRILQEGELTQDVRDVVKICQIWDVMLGTSHLSKDEVFALARFAKSEGFAKIMVTHANWAVMCDYSAGEMRELIELGAWIEFCAAAIFPPLPARTIEDEAALLGKIGSNRCVLATDAGAQVCGTPPSAFRSYLQLLNNTGVPRFEIDKMAKTNPRFLLHMN